MDSKKKDTAAWSEENISWSVERVSGKWMFGAWNAKVKNGWSAERQWWLEWWAPVMVGAPSNGVKKDGERETLTWKGSVHGAIFAPAPPPPLWVILYAHTITTVLSVIPLWKTRSISKVLKVFHTSSFERSCMIFFLRWFYSIHS